MRIMLHHLYKLADPKKIDMLHGELKDLALKVKRMPKAQEEALSEEVEKEMVAKTSTCDPAKVVEKPWEGET